MDGNSITSARVSQATTQSFKESPMQAIGKAFLWAVSHIPGYSSIKSGLTYIHSALTKALSGRSARSNTPILTYMKTEHNASGIRNQTKMQMDLFHALRPLQNEIRASGLSTTEVDDFLWQAPTVRSQEEFLDFLHGDQAPEAIRPLIDKHFPHTEQYCPQG